MHPFFNQKQIIKGGRLRDSSEKVQIKQVIQQGLHLQIKNIKYIKPKIDKNKLKNKLKQNETVVPHTSITHTEKTTPKRKESSKQFQVLEI